MPSASKTPSTRKTATKQVSEPVAPEATVTEPVVAPDEVATEPEVAPRERVTGDLYKTQTGQILRQTEAGLSVLYSPVPVTNVHPFQHGPERYEELIAETFGPLEFIANV